MIQIWSQVLVDRTFLTIPPIVFSCVPMIIYFVYQTSKCFYFNTSNKSRGLIFCRQKKKKKKMSIGTQENNEGGTKVLPTSTCNCGVRSTPECFVQRLTEIGPVVLGKRVLKSRCGAVFFNKEHGHVYYTYNMTGLCYIYL